MYISNFGMIPLNISMLATTLNISWIYLVSVSVFLFLFLLLSPQNLLTLVSYSSNFCISPVYSEKICLFSFQQPGGNSYSMCPLCIHFLSAAVLYVNSVLSIPADSLLQISHFLLWMHSSWKPSVTISILFSPLSQILSLLLWTPYLFSFLVFSFPFWDYLK